MITQILRKSAILLAIYVLLIVGIFVAQFKNDSIISEKFGTLHISLLAANPNDTTLLKNKFNILFNGITFSCRENKPVRATINSAIKDVSLVSWSSISNLSFKLDFTDDIHVMFCVSDDSPKAFLNVIAEFPKNVSGISIPYGLAAGSTIISDNSDNKLQIQVKNMDWELYAADIETERIFVTQKEKLISYSYYDKNRAFSFASVNGIDAASENSYKTVVENFVYNLISGYTQAVTDSGVAVGEQETVAYVAAMAASGRYNAALDTVPSDFKKNSSRTFLSAPYFGTLMKVTEPLLLQLNSYGDLIQRANDSVSYDIFSAKFLVDFICMHPGSSAIKLLMERTAASNFQNINIVQAANILNVYNELVIKNPAIANILEPAAQKCIDKIQLACILDNNVLTLAENGTFLSVIQSLLIGDALYRYGKIVKNNDYISCGRLIVSSYLKDNGSFDLKTLAELYPIIVHGNMYYPHFEILAFEKGQAVWAWTCSNKINYVNDNAGTISFSIDFPQTLTHYLIINGVEQFKSIYIYDLAFRSDYRFETYNSSGYIYQNNSKSLLLKSRHKSNVENVRLVYTVAAQKKAEEITESEVAAE